MEYLALLKNNLKPPHNGFRFDAPKDSKAFRYALKILPHFQKRHSTKGEIGRIHRTDIECKLIYKNELETDQYL